MRNEKAFIAAVAGEDSALSDNSGDDSETGGLSANVSVDDDAKESNAPSHEIPGPTVYTNAPEVGRTLGALQPSPSVESKDVFQLFHGPRLNTSVQLPAVHLDANGNAPISYLKDDAGNDVPIYPVPHGSAPVCKDDDVVSDTGSEVSVKSIPAS